MVFWNKKASLGKDAFFDPKNLSVKRVLVGDDFAAGRVRSFRVKTAATVTPDA